MSSLFTILQVVLLIFAVLMVFNVAIFVHELGHFLAGKWRGLQIDRFQIWFGKPIWKKEIGGVQYGLGWIPAGGFVSLPQMAPMESIEGSSLESGRALPPIRPIDKIIVAAAGPLFSVLLALVAAVVVWGVGRPADVIATNEIGRVASDSPAEKAGIQLGDRIVAVNGEPVTGFAGTLDSIMERVILSRGDAIEFTVERPGVTEPLKIVSTFETEESRWFQRKGVRRVGVSYAYPAVIGEVVEDSPAERAGLKAGDHIVAVDGRELFSPPQLAFYLEEVEFAEVTLEVTGADGSAREITVKPLTPLSPEGRDPMLGVVWEASMGIDTRIVRPGPLRQLGDSVRMMWVTITSVVAKDSNIGVQHLSGPVGIGTMMYDLLLTENGWRRVLGFMVLLNVNLAILNMLPFPVLDGGHIVLAMLEGVAGRPVQAKPLEIIQAGFALGLISLMLYVTSKDIGDRVGRGDASGGGQLVFPQAD